MDEFDKQIARAKQSYEPKPNFVENTMDQLEHQKPHRRWSMKVWVPTLAGAVAVVAIVFIAWPKPTNTDNSSTGPSKSSTSQTSQTTPSSVANDNASLDSDINSIQSSLNQSTSDQNEAEKAVNDNQSQITVPTE